MAQTITIQRGTTTVSNGSNTLLFTQSSGTATRVIMNMVSFYSSGQTSSPTLTVYMASSTGGGSIIGYWKTNNNVWQGQLTPANNGYGPLQYGGNSGSLPISGQINANGGPQYLTNELTANVNFVSSSSNFSYMPSNFYLGPSDSIRLGWYDNNGNSLTVAYSFTTITES